MQDWLDRAICWLADWWLGDADEDEPTGRPRGPPVGMA
jgi:hypothetical protein